MQHAWKHVERPGGSHTASDGKKNGGHLLGTPSNSIIVPESPLDKKNLKRLVSAIETENLKNLKTAVHLVNCIVI